MGVHVGDTTVTQASFGLQAGAKAHRERTPAARGTRQHAATAGAYTNGVAVFTLVRGGLMYQVAVAGQRFSYSPISVASN